ncbi:hypothetical protein BGZ99_000657 [Dissophora globulifera]|uniref:Uncharacterized protein n=1 Tax=Dissophora globulifera TaxID=979702 RepID=A0A9P6UYF2_9FUNG|nr:hypothetical protein BGZ99_000657 [Dissophora globulifera]
MWCLIVVALLVGADVNGSTNSTPNTSPSGSLLREQSAQIDAQGADAVYAHLDTLYRQNEQQRAILTELFTGLGLKAGVSLSGASLSAPIPTPSSSTGSKGYSGSIELTSGSAMAMTSSDAGGSVHRQEVIGGGNTLERQLQMTVRENESLRRENETLKRELDRLRRGGN